MRGQLRTTAFFTMILSSSAAYPQGEIRLDEAVVAQTKVVRFGIAAHTSIGISATRIEAIFDRMNALLTVPDYGPGKDLDGRPYPGDVSCLGLKFEPEGGGVKTSAALP